MSEQVDTDGETPVKNYNITYTGIPSDQRWEYMARAIGVVNGKNKSLDKLGAEGWELICVKNDYFIFKRPVSFVRATLDFMAVNS